MCHVIPPLLLHCFLFLLFNISSPIYSILALLTFLGRNLPSLLLSYYGTFFPSILQRNVPSYQWEGNWVTVCLRSFGSYPILSFPFMLFRGCSAQRKEERKDDSWFMYHVLSIWFEPMIGPCSQRWNMIWLGWDGLHCIALRWERLGKIWEDKRSSLTWCK